MSTTVSEKSKAVYVDKELGQAKSMDDINIELKKIARLDVKFTNEIFRSYTNAINSMLALALKQSVDEDEAVEIEQLRRVIMLCPLEEKFIRTRDKIWGARKHIVNRNADYFLKKDYSKIIKRDANQAFIEALIEIVKNRFETLDDEMKEAYWQKAAYLLNCVVRFKKAINALD